MIKPEPFRKIAVGIDFSPESDLALRSAMNLARHQGASLTLLHVESPRDLIYGFPLEGAMPPDSEITTTERRARTRDRITAMRERLLGQGVDVSQMIAEGYADQTLATAATEVGADLLVVGSHGYTGFKRVMLGSVSEKTVRLADHSVLVVRGDADVRYSRIVIGTDFSSLAERALARALAIAHPEATLHVVACWRPQAPEFGVHPIALAADTAETMARRTRELFGDLPGMTIRHDVVEATPLAGLEATASRDAADLMVVGSHGRRGLRRMVLGSVAEAVVRHAPCSVLVAR